VRELGLWERQWDVGRNKASALHIGHKHPHPDNYELIETLSVDW